MTLTIDKCGLTDQFLLEIMKVCLKDHMGMHCSNREGYAWNVECNCTPCTPENCDRWQYVLEWTALDENYNEIPGQKFFNSEQEAFESQHEYGKAKINIGPETIQILEIRYIPEDHPERKWGDTHTVEMCYTVGTGHEHHALYGVNPETGDISLWAD